MTEQPRSISGDTRREVMSLLLKLGPVTASELGESLGLSAAGVRRHLDKLVDENYAETCEPRAVAGAGASRGRPAKHYQLTDDGRELFGSSYDSLAVEAVELIRQIGGPEAVRAFARGRIDKILAGVAEASDGDVEDTARRLAEVLDAHGYAASVTKAGAGIQICQHHCPVASVAAEHPELCEAEHEAISHLVGSHVQPLALIADGNGICTTNIPLAPINRAGALPERSGERD
ncbi:helix-turn-helix transcriptional regulator [Corynebacterium timonense]|uniref:Predicted transcriptional regulator, ArsR family n=1 Tax=Corynebacterium timonense TaxID=441500 RepID=A0A1H1NZ11_9CORY|nr:metalloregulator ArsR/SmtB family transcription factor [Corynebacterium timonense]SDS04231.1 Predicted transcriptional regulator, ArsR family [Corynebacterium timonense]